MNLVFTNINHVFRKSNNLNLNEYVLADMIYFLSTNKNNKFSGWCYMAKDTMAEEIGLSRQGVYKIINRLLEAGLIEKDDQTGFLRTTQKWDKVYISGDLHDVNKVDNDCKQSLHKTVKKVDKDCKQSVLYNNRDINNNINIDKGESNKKIAPPQSLFEGTDFDKRKKSLFKNCKAFDFEYFEKQFNDDSFKNVDLSYYFHQVNDWSLQKNQLRTLEGWIATARTWMRNDLKAGKLQQKKNGSGMRAEDLEYLRMTNGDFNY